MMRKGLALFGYHTRSTPGVGVQRDLIGTRVIPRSFVLGGVGGGTGGTSGTVRPVPPVPLPVGGHCAAVGAGLSPVLDYSVPVIRDWGVGRNPGQPPSPELALVSLVRTLLVVA